MVRTVCCSNSLLFLGIVSTRLVYTLNKRRVSPSLGFQFHDCFGTSFFVFSLEVDFTKGSRKEFLLSFWLASIAHLLQNMPPMQTYACKDEGDIVLIL